jgi:pimeloyl-ACP methyl ester carboxylesterase
MARYLEALPESAAVVTRAGDAVLRDTPLIVLSSTNASAIERAEHEMVARCSTEGRFEIVPGSGHWIQIDRPDAVTRIIGEMVLRCGS